ncbi:MAG: putative Ig domain-containing protein, partial [Planktomarina sp.]|nr:putative Ig domain-containing protein [Planktomarina sp.]
GELSLLDLPDFETKSSYTVTVLSADEGGKTFSKTFTISVTDVEDTPIILTATLILMENSGLTIAEINKVLGLDPNINLLNFNPLAANANSADALAFEIANQQIMGVVDGFAAAAEGSGASQEDAFTTALNAVVIVMTGKAGEDRTLDLANTSDLELIKIQVSSDVAGVTGVNTLAFAALVGDTAAAIRNVNMKIATVTDLTSNITKNIFSITDVLAQQVKTAASTEVSGNTGFIEFKFIGAVNTSASNTAPTDITLSSTSVSEDTGTLVVGTLGTIDTDQSAAGSFTYSIATLSGSDYASFSINQATGDLSLLVLPDYESKPSYGVTILSTDEGGKTCSKTFTILVTDVNDPPTVVNTISNQTVSEDIPLNFQFNESTFIDVDSAETLTYSATLLGGDTLPSWLFFDGITRTFSGTPANPDVGTISVIVTATDAGSASGSDTFDITVIDTYDPPTVANPIADQTIAEASNLGFRFNTNVFSDDDPSNTISYAATLSDGSALPTWLAFDGATRTFSGTPDNDAVGTIVVKVIVTDGQGATGSDIFNITTTNTNGSPTVENQIADQSFSEHSDVIFQFNTNVFADVDLDDILTYDSTLSSGSALPAWLTFDGATQTFSGTPDNDALGDIEVIVTASDAAGATVFDTFDITIINSNDAPIVSNEIPDQTISEDQNLHFFQFGTDIFSDIDVGDTLTYTASLSDNSALPSWLSFNGLARTFSGTPRNDEVGDIEVTVIATDAAGATASDTFMTTVTNVNDIPTVANAITDKSVFEDSVLSFVFNNNVFEDVDVGDTLTYTATLLDGST